VKARRSAAFVAGGAWLVSVLAGCGSGQGTREAFVDHNPLPPDTMQVRMREPGRYGGRFVIGATASPKTFNALVANEQNSTDVCNLLFESLTGTDNVTQEDTPALARSWEWSSDGCAVTYTLRRGLRFSDGHPLTAEDVRFSFDVVMDDSLPTIGKDGLTWTDPETGRRQPFEYQALDSLTFRVRSPRPYAMMLSAIGTVRILPRHLLEGAWKSGRFASAYNIGTPPDQIVSSGPWRLAEFVPNQKVVLERNPWWYGVDARGRRLPYLDQVVFRIAKDQDAAALMFHAGDLDGLDNVRPEDYAGYEAAQQREGYRMYDIGPSLNTNFLWFNLNLAGRDSAGVRAGEPAVGRVRYAWFSNPDFRRAVSLAIDRDAIVRGPFRGFAVKNWQLLTSGNRAWNDTTIRGPDHDPEAARRILARLGLVDRNGDGVLEDAQGHAVQFTLMTNGDNTVRRDMITLIADDLAKVGIRAIPAPVEMSTLITHIRTDFQYEACLLGLGSAVPADIGMYPNVVKSSGMTHYWHVHQPRPSTPAERTLDSLFARNVYTSDPVVRHRTYHEIAEVMNRQCWFVWLPTQLLELPVRSRFGNVEPTPIPHRILWNVERIFEKSGSPRRP
jgi:peptide/nickel transport system substrate-binding protein